MNKKILVFVSLILTLSASMIFAQSASGVDENLQSETEQTVQEQDSSKQGGIAGSIKYIAAAVAVGFACIGGAVAVGKIGAAAMGAMSENSELSGKALPFVGLAEGICLWGFLVALFILIM